MQFFTQTLPTHIAVIALHELFNNSYCFTGFFVILSNLVDVKMQQGLIVVKCCRVRQQNIPEKC